MGHGSREQLKCLQSPPAHQSYQFRSWGDFEARLMSPPRASSEKDYHLNFEVGGYAEWKPGQFVQLFWGDHSIGRPFSIFEWKPQKQGSALHLLVRDGGLGTHELVRSQGEIKKFWIRGPLGNTVPGWNLENNLEPSLYISEGPRLAAVFPFVNLRKKIQPEDFWIHADSKKEFIDSETMSRAFVCPDQLLLGDQIDFKNQFDVLFPELLKKNFQRVIVAGSFAFLDVALDVMKKFSEFLFQNTWCRGDEVIACAQGLCFSCSWQTRMGPKRSCIEGPWFSGEDILHHLNWKRGI
jgi:NAD(P)H-flavin reductase